MKPEEQRIAIAEARGWTVKRMKALDGVATWLTYFPGGKYAGVFSYEGLGRSLPDYLTDLNAMHEAEKVLTIEQRYKYALWLGPLTTERSFAAITATAAHRAEAFLRTIGKWEGDK